MNATNLETSMGVVPATSTSTSIEATSTATIIDDTPATTVLEASSNKFCIGLNAPTAIIGGSAAILGVGGIVALHRHNKKKGLTSTKADADAAKLQGLLGKITGKGKTGDPTGCDAGTPVAQPTASQQQEPVSVEWNYTPVVNDATTGEYKQLANALAEGKGWKEIMTDYKKSGRTDFLGTDIFVSDNGRLPMAFDGMMVAACNLFTVFGMSMGGNKSGGVSVMYVDRKPTSVQMHF